MEIMMVMGQFGVEEWCQKVSKNEQDNVDLDMDLKEVGLRVELGRLGMKTRMEKP